MQTKGLKKSIVLNKGKLIRESTNKKIVLEFYTDTQM